MTKTQVSTGDRDARREAELQRAEYWRGQHLGLHYKLVLWGVGNLYDPDGTWCYYVYFPERFILNFDELWLPPEVQKSDPKFYGFVAYDYNNLAIANCDWHGGVTFYDKHGEVEGYRSVELGCDFAHLWDRERGYSFTLEEVRAECERTIESIIPKLNLSPDFQKYQV